MTKICKGTNTRGNLCKNKTTNDNNFCYLHQYQNMILEKPSECPICLEEIISPKPLQCGHWIHMECIAKSMKPECPMCRTALKLPKYIKSKIDENLKNTQDQWERDDFQELMNEYNNIDTNVYIISVELICTPCVKNNL